MKIFCVRIGEKYGPEYETYLEEKLPQHEFHWIRRAFHPGVMLQWNKMMPMGMPIDEPVVVMDIDLILMNDYHKIFDYPIARGQFLSMPDWWNQKHLEHGYSLNGGFFKYYPTDLKPVYDKFMANRNKWQQHYIKNGTTSGPVNGEQYFVEDSVKEAGLELILLPDAWFTRWATPKAVQHGHMWESRDEKAEYMLWQHWMNKTYIDLTGNEYLWMDEFHEDIKMVHFTHSVNKPDEWDRISEYK